MSGPQRIVLLARIRKIVRGGRPDQSLPTTPEARP
jgi:hypothetical protein